MKTIRTCIIMLLAAFIVLLMGCSDQDAGSSSQDWMNQEPIQVELIVPEDSVELGTTVKLRARVTQSGEPVEDADRVVFEIWLDGSDEEHERIPGEHTEDGYYEIEKTFSEAGIYQVVSHVDARTWHVMPRKQVTVADASGSSSSG